jgi:hypothetical protein
MVKKSSSAVELEEIRQRILLKQAKLFEKRLDDYLLLSSEDIGVAEKKQLFEKLIEQTIPKDREEVTVQNYLEIRRNLEDENETNS